LPVSTRAPQSKQAIQLLTVPPDFCLRDGNIQSGTVINRLLLSEREVRNIPGFVLSLR
jgi:hypothetical protein